MSLYFQSYTRRSYVRCCCFLKTWYGRICCLPLCLYYFKVYLQPLYVVAFSLQQIFIFWAFLHLQNSTEETPCSFFFWNPPNIKCETLPPCVFSYHLFLLSKIIRKAEIPFCVGIPTSQQISRYRASLHHQSTETSSACSFFWSPPNRNQPAKPSWFLL